MGIRDSPWGNDSIVGGSPTHPSACEPRRCGSFLSIALVELHRAAELRAEGYGVDGGRGQSSSARRRRRPILRLAKPFTMPEVDPVIPDRLSERITTFLPNATKIDIEVAIGTGWRKANAIYLDGDDLTEFLEGVTLAANAAHQRRFRAQSK